jgi:hypothetical protein
MSFISAIKAWGEVMEASSIRFLTVLHVKHHTKPLV